VGICPIELKHEHLTPKRGVKNSPRDTKRINFSITLFVMGKYENLSDVLFVKRSLYRWRDTMTTTASP
jgi:hypothetical protein